MPHTEHLLQVKNDWQVHRCFWLRAISTLPSFRNVDTSNRHDCVRFEVFTAVTMKNGVCVGC
jgi:hypothetical protein